MTDRLPRRPVDPADEPTTVPRLPSSPAPRALAELLGGIAAGARDAARGLRRLGRSPGDGQPAGHLLLVMLAGLALAALVNADALVERAERKPLGPDRDRSLYLWHPVQDVAHVTQLHRLRDLGDWIVGNDDSDAPIVEPEVEVPVGAGRPVLRQPSADDPLRVYIGGDSVVRDAGESFLRLAAEDPLLAPSLHYEIATGLARPDFYDWPAALLRDARSQRPEVAIIMFGGNDGQGIIEPDGTVHPEVDSAGWRTEYGRRVAAVMDALQAEDRLILWVTQPPMRSDDLDRRMRVINEVVAEAAADRPWVELVDTSRLLGDPEGRYADRLPGIDDDLRQQDGIHLSRPGADLLARHLLALIDDELSPPAA